MDKHFNQKGYKVIKFPIQIKNKIIFDIKKIILKKLKLSKNRNFDHLSDIIIKKRDKNFLKLFGSVPSRYLSESVAQSINNWIKKAKLVNGKFNSLHYLSKNDLKIRKDLDPKHYCVFFRCVKPSDPKNLISFPHRDYDFWRIETLNTIPKLPFKIKNRYKLWIPIWNCNNENSLRMISCSHKKKIKVDYLKKGKSLKPNIDIKKNKLNYLNIKQPIKNFSKECILFHDKIVHFAPPNKTNKVRISLEFTIVAK